MQATFLNRIICCNSVNETISPLTFTQMIVKKEYYQDPGNSAFCPPFPLVNFANSAYSAFSAFSAKSAFSADSALSGNHRKRRNYWKGRNYWNRWKRWNYRDF